MMYPPHNSITSTKTTWSVINFSPLQLQHIKESGGNVYLPGGHSTDHLSAS